jgi:hypothetical protein
VRYLSPTWFAAVREALAADPGLATATADLHLTLEQVVTRAPEGTGWADGTDSTVRWHLDIGDGVRVVAGPADGRPDLRFTTTYPTAAAIAAGELAAPIAFIRGELRVGGDLSLLTTHQRALAAIHDVLAEVRKATDYA